MPLKIEGRVEHINGRDIRLFPIATLADMLTKALGDERTTQTIRKWERDGVIPKATFKKGGNRLYAMEQIKCICRVAKDCNIRQGHSASLTDFKKKVWDEMREVNRKLLGKEKLDGTVQQTSSKPESKLARAPKKG